MIKIHRNIAEAVLFNLQQIFKEGKYADQVVERTLKQNPKWGSRDRRFIAEATYDIVRWWRLLCFITARNMDEYPFSEVFAAWLLKNEMEIPDWLQVSLSRQQYNEKYEEAGQIRKIRESIPDWLDEMGIRELGSNWEKEIKALNETAKVVIRVNTLKTDITTLISKLKAEGILVKDHSDYSDALILEKRMNMFNLSLYKEGYFEIQDASSQMVAPFLQITPGMTIIDACAGAGGKTLHLGTLSRNKGKIVAMDIEAHKLEQLMIRAKRAGQFNVQVKPLQPLSNINNYYSTADRLLLDVPCSGLGVLKRNPDTKWKLNAAFINKVKVTQADILEQYPSMLKKSGKMVYSTCSILPSENEDQIKKILLNSNYKLVLEEEIKILPSNGFDGFYMARLIKSA